MAGTEGDLDQAFERTVEEGERRLSRSWPELLATGAVGGVDLSFGVFALLVVREKGGSEIVASVAFTIGFIAVTLAHSELFTENFLVPIGALATRRARWPALVRLWVFTLATNVAAGMAVMAICMKGFPELHRVVLEVGAHYPPQGIGLRSLCGAVLGGAAITLMTWMQQSTESVGAKIVAAFVASFLLAAGPLNHAIVVALELFGGLLVGSPWGYGSWLGMVLWTSAGNLLGGIGLVTVLRLVQVGRAAIEEQAR
jgi:formate/nitrite transporter FocA (FNT family)